MMLDDKAWARKYGGRVPVGRAAFVRAFADHYAVSLYAAIALAGLGLFVWSGGTAWTLGGAVMLTAVSYSAVEYVLHRWVLHATFLCRTRLTAPLWRRLHYDHHMDPADLSVLYANPATSLPLLVLLAAAPAGLFGSWSLFLAMLASNTCAFLYYEFMHTLAHLPNRFEGGWWRAKKRNHLFHHNFDEHENYGIGSNLLDTTVDKTAGRMRSPTVFNLGYDDSMAERYPWVRDGYRQDYGRGRSGRG